MIRAKAFQKCWKQTGSVIVLTALALPFFLACVGLAIDVGNLYIHKSRLQNAADAAALAGGREFANQQETVAVHPQADTKARSYTNLDMATLGGGTLTDQRYKAQQVNDDTILYGVQLTENVPLYFMCVFGMTDTPVVADAAVAIGMVSSGSGNGRDLFIFQRNLHGVNSIENPDNFNIQGQITTTFDGTIAFTDGSGDDHKGTYHYDYLQYSTQTNNLNYFFTEKARNERLSVNQAIAKGGDYAHQEIYEQYNMDELGEATRSRLHLPDYVEGVDWSAIDWSKPVDWNVINKQQQDANNYSNSSLFNGKKDMQSSDLYHDVAWTAKNGDGNVSITINSAMPGGADADPVYVYLDKNISQVNFNVNASNERPLILIYEGTGKLQMNMSNGNTFRGVVYAPRVNESEGLLINANGGTFSGTIISNAINLQGGKGTYRYEDFGVGGGSGGSGGTKIVSSSSTVRLALTDGMDWT